MGFRSLLWNAIFMFMAWGPGGARFSITLSNLADPLDHVRPAERPCKARLYGPLALCTTFNVSSAW